MDSLQPLLPQEFPSQQPHFILLVLYVKVYLLNINICTTVSSNNEIDLTSFVDIHLKIMSHITMKIASPKAIPICYGASCVEYVIHCCFQVDQLKSLAKGFIEKWDNY